MSAAPAALQALFFLLVGFSMALLAAILWRMLSHSVHVARLGLHRLLTF